MRLKSMEAPHSVDDRFLYAGLMRLHVLHHAAREPVYGLAMIEELGRHGYRLSAGTLYPILHGLEKRGYLKSAKQRVGGSVRRTYRATAAGQRALGSANVKLSEIFGELLEDARRRKQPKAGNGRSDGP